VCWSFLYSTISCLLDLVYSSLPGIFTCRSIIYFYILSLLFEQFLWFAYLEFIFLNVLVLLFLACILCDTCVTFLVSCLGLVFSPQEGSNLLPKFTVLFWVFLWQYQKFLQVLLTLLIRRSVQTESLIFTSYFSSQSMHLALIRNSDSKPSFQATTVIIPTSSSFIFIFIVLLQDGWAGTAQSV
jgi:hypothetical protein